MKLAIITDIHEDIKNLEHAFRKIDKLNCNEVICLGDISGFNPSYYTYADSRNAHACISLIKKNCSTVVLGNHDIQAAQIIPKNCSFFDYPKNWYELDYYERHAIAKELIWLHEEVDISPLYTHADIAYLKSLPEYVILELSGAKVLFSHYAYPNLSGLKREFYNCMEEYKEHFNFMKAQDCRLSFTGHSHPNGLVKASLNNFDIYKYIYPKINDTPTCFGIPSITRDSKTSGFCIFDTDEQTISLKKI